MDEVFLYQQTAAPLLPEPVEPEVSAYAWRPQVLTPRWEEAPPTLALGRLPPIAEAAPETHDVALDDWFVAASLILPLPPPSPVVEAAWFLDDDDSGASPGFALWAGGTTFVSDYIDEPLIRAAPVTYPFHVRGKNGQVYAGGGLQGYLTIDDGDQRELTNSPVHKGNGQYTIDLTATETNGDLLFLVFVHNDALPVFRTITTR